jgi:hypothetical protein
MDSVNSFFTYMKANFKTRADKEKILAHLATLDMSAIDLAYCCGAVERKEKYGDWSQQINAVTPDASTPQLNASTPNISTITPAASTPEFSAQTPLHFTPPSSIRPQLTVREINALFNHACEREGGCDRETAMGLLVQFLQCER